MSLLSVDAPEQYPLTFEPVPEATIDGLDEILEDIARRRKENLPSYGAVVFRACSEEDISEIDSGLDSMHEERAYTSRLDLLNDRIDRPLDLGLHWDMGPPNSTTRHLTTKGSIDVAILCDVPRRRELINTKFTHNLGIRLSLASSVLNQESFDTPVERAFCTKIGINDVLLFDETQLHAFRSGAIPRASKARYYIET